MKVSIKAGFSHFDYVNPDAPKGGSLRQASVGTFDSLNPYIEKGTPAEGLSLVYDTLMTSSADEPFSMYPLIAEFAEPARDNSEITFHLDPAARFHDGSAITADDVVFSFLALREHGSPFYKAYYQDVKTVEALSKRSVRFIFHHNKNPELPLIVSQLPVLSKTFWGKKEHDFTAANLSIPMGSGPYRIVSAEAGRHITYQRIEDYWAENLPVNKGRHNFEQIQYDYYRDANVALQALKAGEYDVRYENVARNWATAYDIPAVKEGRLVLDRIPSLSPEGMQGFVYNLRRDKFSDPGIRRALGYALDFEWLNRTLFYDSYYRTQSYFENSDMKATGLPEGKELELLEPWREQLPKELFSQPFKLPKTDGSGRIRSQLSKAIKLMASSGWTLQDGKMQKDGEHFEFEILLYNSGMEKVALPFKKNLEAMGIAANIRVVDISQYINRLRSFDYDMIVARYGQSSVPGNEQREFWGSESADQTGSRNYIGIKSPVVDALIDNIVAAKSRDDLVAAARALDRVLLWGNYMIPQWYLPFHRLAYWQPVNRPKLKEGQKPLYQLDMQTWWRDPEQNLIKPKKKGTEDEQEESQSRFIWLAVILVIILLLGSRIRRRNKTKI